jgi:serine/threonine-protein kinase
MSKRDEPGAGEIREYLERLLASSVFSNSTRLSRFLRFGVNAAISGRNDANEYAIGLDVFERDVNFDPRIDPVVRVHARRLRSKLAHYYETEGRNDILEIHLPMRTYVPVIRWRTPQAPLLQEVHTPSTRPAAIAVYPFTSLTDEKEAHYFAEGLTQELVHALAKAKAWRVVSGAPEERRGHSNGIARHTDVETTVFGTIRKTGERLRVSAEALCSMDGTVLWSQMYDVEIESVIDTQEKLANTISKALMKEVLSLPAQTDGTDNSPGRELYLKGCYAAEKPDSVGLSKSVTYLRQAIRADPDYSKAHAELAEVLVQTVLYSDAEPDDVMPHAQAEAIRALECDPTLAAGHTALALVQAFYTRDLREAEKEFIHAAELSPSSAKTLKWYAIACLSPMGQFDEAAAMLQRALELDPLSLIIPPHLAFILCASKRPEWALPQITEYIGLAPAFPLTHWGAGLVYLAKSDYGLAIKSFETASELSGSASYAESSLAHACAIAGDCPRASAILEKLIDRASIRYVPPLDLALVYVGLGLYDKALREVEIARYAHGPWLTRANIDPRFDRIRAEPRFQAAMRLSNAAG